MAGFDNPMRDVGSEETIRQIAQVHYDDHHDDQNDDDENDDFGNDETGNVMTMTTMMTISQMHPHFQGFKLKMDDMGNILIKRLSKSPVYARNTLEVNRKHIMYNPQSSYLFVRLI